LNTPTSPTGTSVTEFEPGEFERAMEADPFDEVSGIILAQRKAIVAVLRSSTSLHYAHNSVIENIASILNQHTTVSWRFPGARDHTITSNPTQDDGDLVYTTDDAEAEDDEDDALAEELDHLDDERAVAQRLWEAWRLRVDVVATLREIAAAGSAVAIMPGTTCPRVCHRRANVGPYGIVEFTRDVGLPPYGPGCICNVSSATVDDAVAAAGRRKLSRPPSDNADRAGGGPGWQRCKYDNTKSGWVQVDGPGKIHIDPKSGCASVKSSLTEHRGSYACEVEGIRITKGTPVEQISSDTIARWNAELPPVVPAAPAPQSTQAPSKGQLPRQPRGMSVALAASPHVSAPATATVTPMEEVQISARDGGASNSAVPIAVACVVLAIVAVLVLLL
jgi:hypothetical protein